MADPIIEPYHRTRHVREGFSCGKPPLDEFLQSFVGQYEKRNLGRAFVAVQKGHSQVLGYYTLASGSVSIQSLPAKAARKLPRHPVPVALLGRLAVDQAMKGKGLGKLLLRDALQRVLDLSSSIGIHAIAVHAIDDEAKAFYEKFGLVALSDESQHLYLPLSTIAKSVTE